MPYRNSDKITVTVKNITKGGAHVCLDDSTECFISYWEYGYTEQERKKISDDLKIGKKVEVLAYDSPANHGSATLLSIRRRVFDFWGEVNNDFVDKELIIKVNSVTPKRAYGSILWDVDSSRQIELDAYFDFKELDFWIEKNHGNGQWKDFAIILIGDVLKGKVEQIDTYNERFKLNISKYIEKIHLNSETVFINRGSEISILNVVGGESVNGRIEGISRIAVIEDDMDFCGYIVDRLKADGYIAKSFSINDNLEHVLTCDDGEPFFDVYIIDINLHSKNDHRGIDVAKAVRGNYPDAKIILMTGETASPDSKISKAKELLIEDFVNKPFTANDIPRILARAVNGIARPFSAFMGTPADSILNEEKNKCEIVAGNIDDPLKNLVGACRGSTACLFALHLKTGACKLIDIQGGDLKMNKKYISMMKYSPVRDSIQDKEFIVAYDTSEPRQQGKHKWLLQLFSSKSTSSSIRGFMHELSYGSCMGLRLEYEVQGYGHALFWFHPEKDKIKPESTEFLRLTAAQIERKFNLETLRKELAKERTLSNATRTFKMLGHDLSDNLSACDLGLDTCIRLLRQSIQGKDECIKVIENVIKRLNNCIKVTAHYKSFASGVRSGFQETSLQQCVAKAWELVRDITSDFPVYADTKPNLPKYLLEAEPISLQQVFFNILLNAIQQMQLFGRSKGHIDICFEDFKKENTPWARVLIMDSGPGIHTSNFEAIFEEGYSTKPGGTGLGLYMVKKTLEELRGVIRVKSSILFVSTCFEIELPLLRIEP